jgi:hypothetical protein
LYFEIFSHLDVLHLGFRVVLVDVHMRQENLATAVPGDTVCLEKFDKGYLFFWEMLMLFFE